MKYFRLDTHIPGTMWKSSTIDSSQMPSKILKIVFTIDNDFDDIFQEDGYYFVTETLKNGLSKSEFSDIQFKNIEIEFDFPEGYEFDFIIENRKKEDVKIFLMEIEGVKNTSDLYLDKIKDLFVSEKMLSFMKNYNISNCTILEIGQLSEADKALARVFPNRQRTD